MADQGVKPGFSCIYGLKDPRDGQIYYVGKSNEPRVRFRVHLSDMATNRVKAAWISDLQRQRIKPELIILETVPIEESRKAEKKWIKNGVESHWPLTNALPGGLKWGQWHGIISNNKVAEGRRKALAERIERLRRYRLAQLNGQQMAELEGVSRARISQLLKLLNRDSPYIRNE